MEKKSYLVVLVLSLILVIVNSTSVFAHYPPSCSKTDCGLIVGSRFYSEYYTPGNPDGTPVSAGNGTWTRTSNTSCDIYRYNNVNYTLYPHKFICAMPLDANTYYLMIGVAVIGFFKLRKRSGFSSLT
ncbi:MAG: hypothetical protein EOO07_04105 [Chitinophagaceae bacterium]|nr:MAG: hypothetical protein EOO07_04105 [Chitinophagaceae bacterium]